MNSVKAWSLVSVPMQKSIDPEERGEEAKNTGAMPMPLKKLCWVDVVGLFFKWKMHKVWGNSKERCQRETVCAQRQHSAFITFWKNVGSGSGVPRITC